MSDDLIRRKTLLRKLTNCEFDGASIVCDEDGFPMHISIIGMKKIIKDAPSAFDKEKVIEELEDYLFEKYCVEGDEKIAEIVEKGGIE